MMIISIHQYAFANEYEDISLFLWEEDFSICLLERIQNPESYDEVSDACNSFGKENLYNDDFISIFTNPSGKLEFEKFLFSRGFLDVKISDNAWKAVACNLLKYKKGLA